MNNSTRNSLSELHTRKPLKNLQSNIDSEGMSSENLPVGYRIKINDATLEIREYKGDRAHCYCSGCGSVVPALDKYSKETLELWFDIHLKLFANEHKVKKD